MIATITEIPPASQIKAGIPGSEGESHFKSMKANVSKDTFDTQQCYLIKYQKGSNDSQLRYC